MTLRANRSSPSGAGTAAGGHGEPPGAELTAARDAALRIYEPLVDVRLTARELLRAGGDDIKQARRNLLSAIHPGQHHGLSDADTKLLGLAANVVTTAYAAAKVETERPAGSREAQAFAEACRHAREAALWAKKYVADLKPEPREVALRQRADQYDAPRSKPGAHVPRPQSVVLSDSGRLAMNAGLRACLEAYEEAAALGRREPGAAFAIYV